MEQTWTGVQHFDEGDVVVCTGTSCLSNYQVGEEFIITPVPHEFGGIAHTRSFIDRKGERVIGYYGSFAFRRRDSATTLSDFM